MVEERSKMSREYPDRPVVGVGVVVIGPAGVLLVRRGKPPREGQWSLPGGGQNLGETVFDAGRREVREETGLAVEVLGLVDVVDSIRKDADGRVQYHYTLVDVLAVVAPGSPTKPAAAGDAADAAWFAFDELAGLGLWSETERVIDLAREMHQALADADR
jgi:ADP-ribose pyrophosphatase YjhB (NUDIX family)